MTFPAASEPVERVENLTISGPGGDLSLRLYTPAGSGAWPLVVYIHGAGWVAGNLDTHDNVCRCLANRTPSVVVSVCYRLAPEHPFPAALEDAYAALVWAAKAAASINADAGRLAVAGDSSGGNLAAALCLMARDRGRPAIAFQLLVNPALDMTAYDAPGFEEMRWFRDQYLRDERDQINACASSLLADDLRGLPTAFILVGERDNLRVEGERYAARLREAGVFVNLYCQQGKGHLGPTFARASSEAREAVELSAVVLRAHLN
jgi:acetyl esterase